MIELLCEDCREAFPSNQTRVITESRIASRRDTTRLYRGTRGGIGFGGSSGVTTRYKDRTVCLECLHYRAEESRRANRRRAFGWLCAIVAGAAFVVWASLHRAFSVSDAGSNTAYADDAQSSTLISHAPIEAPGEVIKVPSDNGVTSIVPDNQGSLTDNPSDGATTLDRDRAPEAVTEPVRSQQDEINDQGSREIRQAIGDATRSALQTGETANWHKNGQKGFVVVSGPTSTGERICRSVAWTDNTSRSDNVTWCSVSGGEWVPER